MAGKRCSVTDVDSNLGSVASSKLISLSERVFVHKVKAASVLVRKEWDNVCKMPGA